MCVIKMNLGDPELEYIDPAPDIYSMFIHFDKLFFWTKLASRAVVRWSKRMYSCAGVCSYEGRGGLCDIALSEPLLKLRPRKNLVETLLHEMIHAYLFVSGNDRDRDGHGPIFQSHMQRINKATGVNITIYHDFHDEVRLYQNHVWRCNGPCQNNRPYYGIVRRTANRTPGPSDRWWDDHKRKCGGNFVKIKEPEKTIKKSVAQKPMGDITKFINNKTTNKRPGTSITKSNGGNTVVVTQKSGSNGKTPINPPDINNPLVKSPKITPFTGNGKTLIDHKGRSQPVDNAAETVRNVWLKRQETMPSQTNRKAIENVTSKVKEVWANKQISLDNGGPVNKNKRSSLHTDFPPTKTKKIDDYFEISAKILKDAYGDAILINQSNSKPVTIATESQNTESDLVSCPICSMKINKSVINGHLDECLNKGEIERICKTDGKISPGNFKPSGICDTVDLVGEQIFVKKDIKTPSSIDLTKFNSDPEEVLKINKIVIPEPPEFQVTKVTVGDMKMLVEKVNAKDESVNPDFYKISQICPCCELKIYKPMEEHLDECLAFFNNNSTIPEEGASTSYTTIVIDDEDDALDESLTLNATGSKTPCPVCLAMIEQNDMNEHLDVCLA